MMKHILMAALLAALGAMLALACSSADSEDAGTGGEKTCKVNAQCTAAQVCENGKCVATDGSVHGGGVGGGGGVGADGGGGGGTGDCAQGTCTGCCTSTGLCMPGGMPTACGTNGYSCDDCTASGKDCSNGQCVTSSGNCGAGSCTGCCSGGSCLSGFGNTACGNGGLLCTDCTSIGQTCNNGYCQ